MSSVICLILGLFELYATYDFFFNADIKVKEEILYPPILATDNIVRILFCSYLLTLAFFRLLYATSNNTFLSWLCLICGHCVELSMWCFFALRQEFMQNYTIDKLLIAICTFKHPGGVHAFICLIGLPLLIISFIINGPAKLNEKKLKK